MEQLLEQDLNAPARIWGQVAAEIAKAVGIEFTSAKNKFHSLTSYDEVVIRTWCNKSTCSRLNENCK